MVASLLLLNGKLQGHPPDADAMLLEGGKIAFIGRGADAPPCANHFDCEGRTVLPGIVDSHLHLYAIAQNRLNVDVSPVAIASTAEALAAIGAAVHRQDAPAWIIAAGFDEQAMLDRRLPTRADLDAVGGDKPVVLRRFCGHVAVASSAALAVLGLSEMAGGNSDGIFRGVQAADLFTRLPKRGPTETVRAIHDAARDLLAFGITAFTEAAVGFTDGFDAEWAVWESIGRSGRFPLRANFMLRLEPEQARARGIRPKRDPDWQISALKFFADGITGQHTAALNEPYDDRPGWCGELLRSTDDLRAAFGQADGDGWQVAVHAVGDHATDVVTDALAGLKTDGRHRVEHAARLSPQALKRMERNRLIAVPQWGFLRSIGDGFAPRIGHARAAEAYPGRTFLDRGIAFAGSSDAPSGPLSPFVGMAAAMDRSTAGGLVLGAHEALTLTEAINAYTRRGAFASFHDHRRGVLRVGYDADVAVLAEDITTCSGETLRGVRAALTVVGGAAAYTG